MSIENKFFISIAVLSLIALICIGVLITGIVYWVKYKKNHNLKYRNLSFKLIVTPLLVLAIISIIVFVIPFGFDIEDLKSKEPLPEYSINSANIQYKILEEDNKIIKKLRLRSENNNNTLYNKIYLYSIFYLNWRSMKIRKKLCEECEYFVKPEKINHSRYEWQEELISYIGTDYEIKDKEKFYRQLEEINDLLIKKNLYLGDVNMGNIGFNKEGDIRIFDTFFYTYFHKKILEVFIGDSFDWKKYSRIYLVDDSS